MSAVAIDPLEVVPPELYIAWTDSIQYVLFFIDSYVFKICKGMSVY